ncbi:DUF4859 domain-containing protein [Maribellus sediminis]|uniref:DUF4859 domain-containing protein n=1 Tax=Maribellus sediminis TaxID=2696285 RepID=UPI00142FDE36|nr:DUF4859 domain-containing protein [Maribellus sediminis]
MKKINILIILSLIITAGIFSCKDNEDFSGLHDLTDDEIAEIARQDSIAQAQKERINADLVLEYSMDITISGSLYEGGNLEIELDKIAEKFGITEAELLAGIAGESGAPEVKGFAIAGTTHADIAGASNTNAPWGHWWDRRGDLTAWGDSAMVFAEFYPENGYFSVGQYPGHLTAGQKVTFIEALKYNEIRIAVKITVNAVAPGQITADVVSTQDLTIEVTAKSVYDPDPLTFDLAAVLNDLGIDSLTEATFIGVNEDGSYATEAVTGYGFWYDFNGYVGAWGDNASVYTNYGEFEDNQISIGQYPDHLAADETYTIKYGFMANNKIVMLNITIKVLGYVDPETAPEGNPEAMTIDIELSKPYSNDYASVTADIKETFRQAFKMTTYQIHKAIGDGTFKLYQGAVTEEDPSYTADVPGYWLKEDGTAGGWGESVVWTSVGHSETDLYLYGGNHPDNATAGMTVTTTYIATCNGGSVTINLTFIVEGDNYIDPETAPEGDPENLTIDVTLSKPYSDDYASVTADVKETLRQAFKMTTYQIHKAIQDGTLKLYQGSASEVDPSYTADVPGYWLNADGTAVGWAEGVVWTSLGHSESELYLYGGNHPENATAGTTVTTTYVAVCNGGSATINLTFVIEGETTPEPKDLTLTYNVSFAADSVNYSGTTVSLSANGDIDKVAEALLMESSAIEAALLAAKETPQEGKIAFAAVEPGGSLNYNTTANGLGFWFDSTGAVIGWGSDNDSKLFSEFTSADFTFSIGQFPGKSSAGDTYTVKEAFVYTKDGVEYQVTFVFNVTIN